MFVFVVEFILYDMVVNFHEDHIFVDFVRFSYP